MVDIKKSLCKLYAKGNNWGSESNPDLAQALIANGHYENILCALKVKEINILGARQYNYVHVGGLDFFTSPLCEIYTENSKEDTLQVIKQDTTITPCRSRLERGQKENAEDYRIKDIGLLRFVFDKPLKESYPYVDLKSGRFIKPHLLTRLAISS
ncbi:MAG: hypothetical protein WC438_02935 [Candidatus Pacearchaeota archaeon]